MRRRMLFFCFYFGVNSLFGQGLTPEEILLKVESKFKTFDYLSGELSFTLKDDDPDNNYTQEGSFFYRRIPSDTIFGGRFKFLNDDYVFAYDSDYLYQVKHFRKRTDIIKGSYVKYYGTPMISLALPREFMGGRLAVNPSDSRATITFEPAPPGKWTIKFERKIEDPDLEEWERWYTIDQSALFIEVVRQRTKVNGSVQTHKWQLDDRHFDSEQIEAALSTIELPMNYQIRTFPLRSAAQDNQSSIYLPAGTPVMPFAFPGLTGDTIRSGEIEGKLVLLDFWEYWCGGCLASIPKLQQLHEKYRDKGLAILGVFRERPEIIRNIVRKRGLTFQNVQCDEEFLDLYKIKAWPTVLLVKDQKVVFAGSGNSKDLEDQILKHL